MGAEGPDADADPGGPEGRAEDGAEVEPEPARDGEVRDELPEDLDPTGLVGPYLFPNNNRRRIPAVLYWIIAAGCVGVWLVTRQSNPVLVNTGVLGAGLALALFGGYSFIAGWDLEVDERDALVIAARTVGFPVGHASAQMGWRGLLSRPTWRILVYSAEDPPEKRGLVIIDGVRGSVVEWFVEDNPETWDTPGAR